MEGHGAALCLDVAGWETEEEFVDAEKTDPDGCQAELPSELGESGVDHEVLAPPEEGGDNEVAEEDGDGHYGVEGEGEDAPALTEGHFTGLVEVSLRSLVSTLVSRKGVGGTHMLSWQTPVEFLSSFKGPNCPSSSLLEIYLRFISASDRKLADPLYLRLMILSGTIPTCRNS